MPAAAAIIDERLKQLESHLERENPILLDVVKGFRRLDQVAYRMGLLSTENSYATQIPWWPLVSILGTFSAGKSSFINTYLGDTLQRTGNQAVDDKFSVICYSGGKNPQTLPGVALDSDPRFPFYQFSHEIEEVAEGEGERIDAYLQLKTVPSEHMRGKILIDSPGFDADSQRTSTLRITDHIIALSDLVLVFFDARHPEPGAMQDTLRHLVENTISRPDSEKFLYILNQIDTAAKEDNPEDVIAAWQRALAEKGLTAGRFYTIYNEKIDIPIEDENLKRRFQAKRDEDLGEIKKRMHQVEVQRAYRIVSAMDKVARDIELRVVNVLKEAVERWRRRVLWADAISFGTIGGAFLTWTIQSGYWEGLSFTAPWWQSITSDATTGYIAAALTATVGVGIHFLMRNLMGRTVMHELGREDNDPYKGSLRNAFARNLKPWRSIFSRNPAGWGRRSRKDIQRILADVDKHVQALNDKFTDPSGDKDQAPKPAEPTSLAPTPTEAQAPAETAPVAAVADAPRS